MKNLKYAAKAVLHLVYHYLCTLDKKAMLENKHHLITSAKTRIVCSFQINQKIIYHSEMSNRIINFS
jgi:hypothetical protein